MDDENFLQSNNKTSSFTSDMLNVAGDTGELEIAPPIVSLQ